MAWNLFANRWDLLDWRQIIIYWIVSIGLSVWIYKNIENVDNILPKGEALLEEMWLLIIVFLYSVINRMKFGESRAIKRKDTYISSRYEKFKSEYNDIIHPYFNNPTAEVLTYSIMIYEDFNRPFMIRMVENLKFFVTRKPHTLGIMQVTTDRYINDTESVRLAIQKIAGGINDYIRENSENSEAREEVTIYTCDLIYHIAALYNGGNPNYSAEIMQIFDKINSLFYHNEISSIYSDRTGQLQASGD